MSHLVVNPVWPLLAVMFGGAWLSWPWFLFNGWALGSPTRAREAGVVVAGVVGAYVLMLASVRAIDALALPLEVMPYFYTVVLVWRLGVTYHLAEIQSRGFEVYAHYGGRVRNGLLVAIPVAFVLRPQVDAILSRSFFGLALQ
jgi:hypothetical protein